MIENRLRERTTREQPVDCEGAQIPAAPINSLDAVSNSQITAHNLVIEFSSNGNNPVNSSQVAEMEFVFCYTRSGSNHITMKGKHI
jgi:hypothetical protein